MAEHLIVLAGALATILLLGVGWRERFRWTPTIERRVFRRRLALEAQVAALRHSMAELRRKSDAQAGAIEAVTDQLFDHICKPSAVAHSPALKKAAPVKAPAKKAPAKKATTTTSQPGSSARTRRG